MPAGVGEDGVRTLQTPEMGPEEWVSLQREKRENYPGTEQVKLTLKAHPLLLELVGEALYH